MTNQPVPTMAPPRLARECCHDAAVADHIGLEKKHQKQKNGVWLTNMVIFMVILL